jgi:alpha-L-rhamnosidase
MKSIKNTVLLAPALLNVALVAGMDSSAWIEREKENRPNIIFILTDDQRWDALGYAGNKIIHTPEMDKLAKDGVHFRNGLVSTPICSASRASIFTGLYERTHRYTFQTRDMPEEYMNESYPKLLNEAGYFTGFFGKFGVRYAEKSQLFDVIDDYDRNNRFSDYRGFYYKTIDNDTVHLTRYTGHQALEFLDQVPDDQPFCLSLSFSAPHAHDRAPLQYFWTDASDHLYRDMEISGPVIADDEYFYQQPEFVREGFNRLRWGWRYDTPEKYQQSMKGYYRMIYDIDLEIAKIRNKLKEKRLDKNTIIIFMGDNGYFTGERQLAGKWLMYDNSLRVPLIIYDPRVRRTKDKDDMALNIDIPATILDYAGVTIPESYHGRSLVPLVSGRNASFNRDTVLIEHLWEFENIPPSEGVRTNNWKYFRYVNDQSFEELYYLPDDPKEVNNLAEDPKHQGTLIALRYKLNQMIGKYADPYSGVPHGKSVEYIRQPHTVGINTNRPVYSWIVPDEAVSQQAYQILVASSGENISKNIGDVWNSGQVRSNISTSVDHQGQDLDPNSVYYWKVRIWDQHNRLSEYSDNQRFNTGNFEGFLTTGNSYEIAMIEPVNIEETASNTWFVDFEKAAFGTVVLNYSTPKIDTLTIRLGEKNLGNTVDMNPGGTIRFAEVKLPVSPSQSNYTVELVPDSRNTNHMAIQLPDSFDVIMPFRYVEIENHSAALKPENIFQKAYFGYFEDDQSYFSSCDTVLNHVWDLCKYSLKATTFAGYYVDGDRERIPYEADAYINQLSHYGVDAEYAIGRLTAEYFMENPTWPTEWLLHTVMLLYEDYYYTGNTRLIEAYYENLKHKTLIDLAREDGLITTFSEKHNGELMSRLGFADTTQRMVDIVDWPPDFFMSGGLESRQPGERDGYDMVPVNTVVNSFFYYNMVIMEEFASLLNKPEDEVFYRNMASKVKESINQKLFNHEKGIYVDGEGSSHSALHANMMPLAFGIVPEEHKKSVVEFVKSRGMACSVYGAQYLLDALYAAGEDEFALDLMRATHDRSWWNMIAVGSTITLEAWDMKYKKNLDWNHAWGAVPANIIPRRLWGITPKLPGFEVVSIEPQLGGLNRSSIVTPTIKGKIKSTYNKINNRNQIYTIELPANMVGELKLKLSNQDIVTVNNEVVSPQFGTIRLLPGKSEIKITVNSF